MTSGDVEAVESREGTNDGQSIFGVRPKTGPQPREGLLCQPGEERHGQLAQVTDPIEGNGLFKSDVLDGASHDELAIQSWDQVAPLAPYSMS